MSILKSPRALLAVALMAGMATSAQAAKLCVFDPVGTQGDIYGATKDLALAAKAWGANNFELKAFTDERVAAEDFKAGQCDAIVVTTLRARAFNSFVGSIDSVGGVPTQAHLQQVIRAVASPALASRMVNQSYEIAGVIPVGGAYVMVRDRSINSVEKAAGKKVAVLEWDKSQAKMVQQLGAQPVASDVTNFAGKFNNGQVDIIAAPAVAYKPLELYKGIGTKGAIYRFPLIQTTLSMVIRKDKFPAGFGQKSREYFASHAPKAFGLINRSEKEIPESQWLELTPADKDKYTKMMREVRIQLTKDGTYDKDMMKLLKNLRCKMEPQNFECALNDE